MPETSIDWSPLIAKLPPCLLPKEAADLARLSMRSMRRLLASGAIASHRPPGSRKRYVQSSSLLAYLTGTTTQGAA